MVIFKEYYAKRMPLLMSSIGVVENSWIFDLLMTVTFAIVLFVVSLIITITYKLLKKNIISLTQVPSE